MMTTNHLAVRIRTLHPAQPPAAYGPCPSRAFPVYLDGLTADSLGEKESRLVQALWRRLGARFGDHRLERHYLHHERVGYLTYVRHERDFDWLRLLVAMMVEAVSLPVGTVRVRRGDP